MRNYGKSYQQDLVLNQLLDMGKEVVVFRNGGVTRYGFRSEMINVTPETKRLPRPLPLTNKVE